MIDSIDNAISKTAEYIDECYQKICDLNKPMVLEEFGYPRDNYSVTPGSPTVGRDRYYQAVFWMIDMYRDMEVEGGKFVGCSFWGWGGYASQLNYKWQPWDDYTCDPAFEEQGLNSVFAADSSTLRIIRDFAGK
jgi:mannan endo-1,4-beta-mannosidase